MENNSMNIPAPIPLPGREIPVPYFVLGDGAFPLNVHVMKVFSGLHPKGSIKRSFNYRLCRARRVVENVFGISSSVFRVLRKPMLLEPEKAEVIVMSVAHLHNFLKKSMNSVNIYTPSGTFDREVGGQITEGNWRSENNNMASLLPIRNMPRRSALDVKKLRNEIANYFVNEGGGFVAK